MEKVVKNLNFKFGIYVIKLPSIRRSWVSFKTGSWDRGCVVDLNICSSVSSSQSTIIQKQLNSL